MTTDRIAECKAALKRAEADCEALDSVIREEKTAAVAAINLKFKDQKAALNAARADANQNLIEAKNALPDHEWTRRRVYRTKNIREWVRVTIKRTEGIVETRRSTTEFPANKTWGLPAIGQGFGGLLKKDGTPGLKMDWLNGWKLVETGE